MAERLPVRDSPRAANPTGAQIIGRALKRILFVLVTVVVFAYLIDLVILQYRIEANKNPYGIVAVRPYYAVPQKDHKTEFLTADPQNETCVHSLFPHRDDAPCWYLSRHSDKRIDM